MTRERQHVLDNKRLGATPRLESGYRVDSYSPIDGRPRTLIDLDVHPPETWAHGTWIEEDSLGMVTRVAWQRDGELDVRDGPDYYVVLAGLVWETKDYTDKRSWFWRWLGRKTGARL